MRAEDRYQNETRRLYGVLEKRLENNDFIAGDYSIADMACWNFLRWYTTIAERPAVQKGCQIPKYVTDGPMP